MRTVQVKITMTDRFSYLGLIKALLNVNIAHDASFMWPSKFIVTTHVTNIVDERKVDLALAECQLQAIKTPVTVLPPPKRPSPVSFLHRRQFEAA